jgi:exopolysaccharide biosynthesis polyprenyl glycosylphosphotransferase
MHCPEGLRLIRKVAHNRCAMTTRRKVILVLLSLDIISVLLVFNIVIFFRGLNFNEGFLFSPLIAPALAVVFAIYLIDGYNSRMDMIGLDYTSLHTIAVGTAMLATLLLTYVVIPSGYELQSSRIVIALGFCVLIPSTLSYRRIVYQSVSEMRGTRSLVFLGDEASCLAFHQECDRVGVTQPVIYCVAGELPAKAKSELNDPLHLRTFATVLEDIRQSRLAVEAIILRETNREWHGDISGKLVELYFAGVPTYTLELFHQVYWRKIPLYRLNQTWLFQEGFQIAREPVFERLKRATDVFLSLTGLVLASPLILLGGLAVWLQDRGPIFFIQNRVGKNHVSFRLLKLRSMRSAGPGDNRYTQVGDERITRVGRFLRVTRIDEFPQLWNVLRGDMSLIGPRAEWDMLVQNYEREIPCYHFRHLVKPGITGWAQVNYPYGANLADTMRKLEYDLYYIRHFSFLLDAAIVLKTFHVMLFGRGR